MKTITGVLFAVLGLTSISAAAAPCTVLEYAEMKDMSMEELKSHWCKTQKAGSANFSASISRIGSSRGKADGDDAELCSGQLDRIKRVMVSKGGNAEEINAYMCSR